MKKYRSFLSILLVLCMLFQPFVPLLAQNANSGEVSDAEAQFLDAYNQITALEPIDIEECKGIIAFATGCENVGHGIVNVGKAIWNFGDNLFGGGNHQAAYDEYADYIGQIEEANQKIADAKAQAEEMKKAFDEGGIDAAKNADPSKVNQGSLETQMQAMDDARTALTDAGNALKEVANVMSIISTVLGALGTVAELLALIPALSGPCAVIALCLNIASDVLDPAAECLDSAGDGLLAAAQQGAFSEAGTYAMDNFEHTLVEEAPKAALNIALDVVSSDVTGLKESAIGYMDDTLDFGGDAAKFWDGSGIGDIVEAAGTHWDWSPKMIEATTEIVDSVPQTAIDLYESFTGKDSPIQIPSIPGAEEIGKAAVGDFSGWVADQVAPAYHEPDLNYEGDDEE